jgi:tetratricopeptide (TPR) repeat protein
MSAIVAAKGGLAVVALVGVLTLTNSLSARVQPALESTAGMSEAQQEKIEQIAAASLFGQFRTSMADFLWLKTDKYLHNGVDLRGTTELEKEAGHADKVESAKGEVIQHAEETTVVPSKRRDWRGYIGDIERQVRPYEDMSNHTHKDPKEALPLFRLMTWSNPRFIPGYIVGASLIAMEKAKVPEAIAFLREGVKNNPESIEIHNALGQMLTSKVRRFEEAQPHLRKAIDLALARDARTLTEDEMDAWQNAYRWLVLNRREAGDPAAARQAARDGLKFFPDDVVCRRYLEGKKPSTP